MIETRLKETELGRIPQDWRIISLGDVGEVQMCKRILKEQTAPKGDIPFYKIGTFGKCPDAFISKELFEEYKLGFNYPQKGDILISAAGTIGRTVIFDGSPSYFQDSNIVWIANDGKKVVNELLYYLYDTFNWITETGTIPRIYNNTVRSIRFAIPSSIDEQRAIAEALSDIDKLIAALDKKIEKQKMIKQGVMQELLTGKRRLEGFSEPWRKVEIGDIVKIQKGQSLQSKDFILGGIPVIAGGQTIAGYHNVYNHREPCVTISASGAYAGFIWLHKYPIFATDCSVIEGNEEVNVTFLYYLLKLNQESIYRSQSGGAQPHIHPKDIMPIAVEIPPIVEQKAIADIIMSLDDDIDKLEAKRNKNAQIKQGMMQQLLTGKIRLK